MATKVSQATIDKIKKMGMTKALGGVKSTSGAEYKEALRRMYGQRRLDAALGKGSAKYTSADSARSSATSRTTTAPRYTSADAARTGKTTTTSKTSAPAKKTTVKVTDTRPGATGGTVKFKTSSVNAPAKPKTAAQTAAKKAMDNAKKYVPTNESNFKANPPRPAAPKKTPKKRDNSKVSVGKDASWRY